MKEIVDNFANKHILVVGDLMLDEFLFGVVRRINPEAPTPVLEAKNSMMKLGGAANVAANIVALGGKCTVIGRVGNDEAKKNLEQELIKQGINYKFLIDSKTPTTRKVRAICKNQHLLRIDYEERNKISDEEANKIIQQINEIEKTQKTDLIVFSDYNKGVLTKKLAEELKKKNIKIIADGKPENKELFKDVFLITPNVSEAQELSGMKGDDDESIEKIGKQLMKDLNCNVLITRSEKGATLFEKEGKIHHVPTNAIEVFDVTGAGDTVVAALASAIAAGASLEQATTIANHAAGIVVRKIGTATASKKELLDKIGEGNEKIKTWEEMKDVAEDLKRKNKKIIFTNGCYDILHTGHLYLLNEAKKQGDILILGLNTDDSVRRYKGPTRPINNQTDRGEVMASLKMVDYVVFFDEDDPCKIIDYLRPDIHVKGGDYDPNNYVQMPEAKVVHDYGGKVHIVPLIAGKSTTNTLQKMKS